MKPALRPKLIVGGSRNGDTLTTRKGTGTRSEGIAIWE